MMKSRKVLQIRIKCLPFKIFQSKRRELLLRMTLTKVPYRPFALEAYSLPNQVSALMGAHRI